MAQVAKPRSCLKYHTDEVVLASFPNGSKMRSHIAFGIETGAPIKFDPGLSPYIRTVKADGQGNFAFRGIPPGAYYVIGNVNWCVPASRYGGCDKQGGDLLETVVVSADDSEVATMLSGS